MADITVRGAGIFGLSVAWACLRRGARVQVIDPNGVGTGSSGGIVGALAPHVPENWNDKKAFQLQSLLMMPAYWAEVAAVSGLPTGYAPTGRLQPLPDARAVELARARESSARDLWPADKVWQVIPAPTDWAPPSATGLVSHDKLSAHLHPRQALTALAAAIRAQGAQFLTDGPAQGLTVWATGHQDAQVTGVKGQAALLDYDARGKPQLFADGLHIIPHSDGTTAIGSTSEREWTDTGTDAQLDALITKAKTLFPPLQAARTLSKWAGIRPRSASRAPILGAHPDHPGAYIANGGFKIGFGMAPLVGEVMADLILEGRDTIPDGFKP